MSDWFEVAFEQLYPVLYPHRDDAEARRMVSAFGDRFARHQPVLDLACGPGRYMGVLADAGVDVWGVDLSEFLLSRAAALPALSGRLVRGDMRRIPFTDGAFGMVINMFTSFGYFADDEENAGVCEEVSRVLSPGGCFVLDFVNAGWVLSRPLQNTVRTRDGYIIDERRRAEDDDRFLVKDVIVTHPSKAESTEYQERVRLFRPEELAALVGAAGLSVAERYGDYDRGPFDPRASQRVILVCEKPEGTQ